MGSHIAFVGPSIPSEYLREASHSWIVKPPVQRGDLVRLGVMRGDVVGIIDGVTGANRALCHKEVLAAIASGVRIAGAAGVGALKAAELCTFGMEGVGRVFEAFARGDLDGDDEVLVACRDDGDGREPITEAMVNIRHRLDQAVQAGVIDRDDALRLAAIGKSLCFTKRTYARLFELAAEAGIARDAVARFELFVQQRRTDPQTPEIQTVDAIALLRSLDSTQNSIATQTSGAPNRRGSIRMTSEGTGRDVYVRDSDIVGTCSIVYPFYSEIHAAVALRTIAVEHGTRIGASCEDDAVLLARFRAEHSLASDERLAEWLSSRSMSENELVSLLKDIAIARAAADLTRGDDRLDAPADLEGVVVDSLMSNGMLPATGDVPEELSEWLSQQERRSGDARRLLARLAIRACSVPLERIVLELAYRGLLKRARKEAAKVVRFGDEDFAGYARIRVSEDVLLDWAASKWPMSDDIEHAMLDRGFRTLKRFQAAASLYFLYEQVKGDTLWT